MPGLALTDHGCMFGAWSFHKQATKAGLKPIVGMEAYVAPGDRRDRSRSGQGDRAYYHLVLLARDLQGYRNLVKLSSLGYTEGFYHKPRVDRELLAKHHEGIVVSSACMAGEVARHLQADNWAGAREAAEWYANLFDGRYYLEVQAHDSDGQAELNQKIFKLADELGLPVVATNDAHFLQPEDHEAHDVLLCIGLGKDRSDPGRMKYDKGLYFKSGPEMADRFPDRPDVLENTVKIADETNLVFEKKYYLPEFPLPESHTDENDYLEFLSVEGAKQRYGDPLPPEILERLDYEMGVVKGTGYAGYFLITQDFIRWAREHDIPVGPGRGSAAGSLVAYALGITNLDPIEHDLLFERFLNPERVSMPDIDIDFCFERRGEVIEYTRQKYGKDAVGQIITFGTLKSRAVIRDVGRALGFEPSETDRIAKLIPNQPGQAFTVKEAVDGLKEVKDLYKLDDRHRQLLDYSMTLEGLSRHASVHAAGVVIAPGPLDDYVPVSVQTGKNGHGDDAMAVTQYDMNCLEEAGMLKMDFLGLRTLTVIHDAVIMVRDRFGGLKNPDTGEAYETIDDIPLDDHAVYDMMARGGTSGIFQFESSLANDKLRAMKCDRFDDLVATNALIRPGPLDSGMADVYIDRKLGRKSVSYPHPDLEKVLEPTYGVIVYQEQVMRIANVLAGFSLGEADVLRKAVGKKIAELIKKELGTFVERAVERGVEKRVAEDLAEQIETFGRYGFNKSHSAAYSLISYHTAWLKAHYPAEFMAALLSSVLDNTDSVVKYIGECRELARYIPKLDDAVEVLPPDVNESGWKFTVTESRQIRFGLGAVRGVGSAAVTSIIDARKSGGSFVSLFDFLERIDIRALNKRACEALIAAGALDAFGYRSRLLAGLDSAYAEVQVRQAEVEAGQASLFGDASVIPQTTPSLPNVPDWPEAERLAREKAALGFFISGHPLDRFREVVRAFEPVSSATLADRPGQAVDLPCVVTSVARQISRKDNSEWGKITVEDFQGTATILAFKDVWQQYKDVLQQDAVVLISGKVSGRERDEDARPVFLDAARPLEDLTTTGELAVEIGLEAGSDVPGQAFDDAKALLTEHPGAAPVILQLGAENGESAPRFKSRSLRVVPDAETVDGLQKLFGRPNVRIIRMYAPRGDDQGRDR